jgi:microcompartment protein CcmK/EutM
MFRKKRGKIAPKGGMHMMIGTVIGQVVLSRGVPGAGESRFVQVRCGCALVTALDPLGVQTGERVLVTAGDGAVRMCPEFPVDTVILGVAGNNG